MIFSHPLLDRRALLKALAAAPAAAAFGTGPAIRPAAAQTGGDLAWRHGLSLFNSLKYPPDFPHFAYVNPQAPKGGRVRLGGSGSFDSLNPYTFKGSAASLIGLTNDTLMTSAMDEASTEYGLVADAVKHPDNKDAAAKRG